MSDLLSILAIFKNETTNLRLWIEHYRWQGVQHFYLIDNGSTDDPLEILRPYIDEGIVTYREMPERHRQVNHYQRMYTDCRIRERTRWLIIADLDEFFFGVDAPLGETLAAFGRYAVINVPWSMFGTHLDRHPPDIRTALTERAPAFHPLSKYMFQTGLLHDPITIQIHSVDSPQGPVITETRRIRLNHYPLQSLEYFTHVKIPRGDACWHHHDRTRSMEYFTSMQNDNQGERDTLLADLVIHGYRGSESSNGTIRADA